MADPPSNRPGDTREISSAESGRGPRTPTWVKLFAIAAVIGALLVGGLLLVGGDHGPGRHMQGAGGRGHAPPSGGHQNTGGAGASDAVGGPADADDASRTIEVTALDTMAFEPSRIEVSAGEIVTFVVTNGGRAVHEFTLGDAAMQQEHADEMAGMPGGMAHDQANSITVEPGETRQLTWRFGDAGVLEYACHEPGHYQAGMRGRISVG